MLLNKQHTLATWGSTVACTAVRCTDCPQIVPSLVCPLRYGSVFHTKQDQKGFYNIAVYKCVTNQKFKLLIKNQKVSQDIL